ncbi:MAG: trigger factor [Phycisphaerae bacterium]
MEVPGVADAMESPELREKAEKRAESLLEKLKESVQAKVEDAGVLRKTLTVTVPASIIGEQIEEQFDDFVSDAFVPGFRKGRAPRELIQKRYGSNIRDSLKTSVVGQSYMAATEKNELDVLGDPLFRIDTGEGVKLMDFNEALTQLKLPEEGDFEYACEVEVKPAFELPELKGVEVKTPVVEITDEMVDDTLTRRRKIQGRFVPVKDGSATDDDMLIADVILRCDGEEVKREANLQLGVRPTRLDGIPLMELDQQLKGAKVGSKIKAECTIPDDYERADLRGKSATFEFEIHEIKRLEPISMDKLAEQMGVSSEKELRDFTREDLESERNDLIERAKREQVLDYLLEKVDIELPEQLSARQTDRAVMRSVIDLNQRGMPESDIEAKIDELRTSAKEQVQRELRLQFILEKVAEQLGVRVTDEEVNTEIARIARRYGRRFDRVRDDLQREGLLMQLAVQIQQDKSVAKILEDAKFVEVNDADAKKSESKKADTKKAETKKSDDSEKKSDEKKSAAKKSTKKKTTKKSTKKKE